MANDEDKATDTDKEILTDCEGDAGGSLLADGDAVSRHRSVRLREKSLKEYFLKHPHVIMSNYHQ